jgi:hypothetical protein
MTVAWADAYAIVADGTEFVLPAVEVTPFDVLLLCELLPQAAATSPAATTTAKADRRHNHVARNRGQARSSAASTSPSSCALDANDG